MWKRLADHRRKGCFYRCQGSSNFLQSFCTGDPIIVIHGGPGMSQDYLLPQMIKLAETHQLIFYDQRGCGHSTCDITPDSIQVGTFIEDLEAIRKSLGHEKVTVLGHSWGGFLALHYANSHPESINKLIIMDSMPLSSEEFSLFAQEWMKRMAPYQEELKALMETPEFAEGDLLAIEKYYRTMFEIYCYNSENAHDLNLYMSPEAFINGMKVYEILAKNVFKKAYDFYDQLAQIHTPTLILHGDYDPIPSSAAQNLHEHICGSTYILLKNCGHFPYVECPDKLFKHINDFLLKK